MKRIDRTVKNLEETATALYKKFLANSTSDSLKNFYAALVHAEQAHVDFASAEMAT